MKKIFVLVFAVLIGLSFIAGVTYGQAITGKRAETYQKFGPKLMDAVVQVMTSEINEVRTNAGLKEKTNEEIMDEINTILATMEDYDWMEEQTK